MPTNLGTIGAYGAKGASDEFQAILAERMKQALTEQARQDKLAQEAIENQRANRGLDIQQKQIDESAATRAAAQLESKRLAQANAVGGAIDDAAPGSNLTSLAESVDPENQLAQTRLLGLRKAKEGNIFPVGSVGTGTTAQGEINNVRSGPPVGVTTEYYKPDAVRPPQAQRTQFRDIPAPAGKSGKWQQLYDLDTSKPIGEPSPAYESPTTGQGENDRSYQYTRSKIDTLKAPLAARAERLTRLSDALDSEAPAIDPLIAPELISSMAGGQGTGIRVNQAEIQSAVGGRSHWQELKAALDKWSHDPTKPFLVTPEQRQQIRAIVKLTSSRVSGALKDIDDAGDQLVNAPDVATHRKLYQDLQKKLTTAAQGGESGPAKPQYDLVLQPDGSYKAVKRGG